MDLSFTKIESIKSFEYSVASTGICISPNQKRIISLGIYQPAVKMFDLSSMTMKFERHLVADGVKALALVENGEKFVVLRNDRTFEFHTRNGMHDQIKMPGQSRDICFNSVAAELYSGGRHDEIYRVDLGQGRFLKGMPVNNVQSIVFSNENGLIGCADNRKVYFIDSRNREIVLSVNISDKSAENNNITDLDDDFITSIAISKNGIEYAVGTNDGSLSTFDLRSPGVINNYNLSDSVNGLKYSGKYLISASKDEISVFSHDYNKSESNRSVINAGFLINSFDVQGGLIAFGGENEKMQCYYADKLGSVPTWCSEGVIN